MLTGITDWIPGKKVKNTKLTQPENKRFLAPEEVTFAEILGKIRVPLIVKYPGVIKAGAVCDEPTMSTDFYPTVLQLAGLALRPELHKDGISLVPLLTQKNTSLSRTDLYWHYPHYHGSMWTPGSAIRNIIWKQRVIKVAIGSGAWKGCGALSSKGAFKKEWTFLNCPGLQPGGLE